VIIGSVNIIKDNTSAIVWLSFYIIITIFGALEFILGMIYLVIFCCRPPSQKHYGRTPNQDIPIGLAPVDTGYRIGNQIVTRMETQYQTIQGTPYEVTTTSRRGCCGVLCCVIILGIVFGVGMYALVLLSGCYFHTIQSPYCILNNSNSTIITGA
jgi:hypothetical protein